MQQYGMDFIGGLVFLAFFGGIAAFGFRTGTLPRRGGAVTRKESPVTFFAGMVMFSGMALVGLYEIVHGLLRIGH